MRHKLRTLQSESVCLVQTGIMGASRVHTDLSINKMGIISFTHRCKMTSLARTGHQSRLALTTFFRCTKRQDILAQLHINRKLVAKRWLVCNQGKWEAWRTHLCAQQKINSTCLSRVVKMNLAMVQCHGARDITLKRMNGNKLAI